MRIVKTKDYNDMSVKAANIIAGQINLKEDSVLGLATGSTPVGAYKQLIASYKAGNLDFSKISSINLDEYVGLGEQDDQSYRYFMNNMLFDHVNIDKANTYVPNGLESDPVKACKDYDKIIKAKGGIDLQLLGLGNNGHIGFNEPADNFAVNTNCVDLAPSTIEANSRFFETEARVPKKAYTVGIKAIMQAKCVVIVVSGKGKAKIVKEAFFGPVTPHVPASILQFHLNCIVVADEEALSEVEF